MNPTAPRPARWLCLVVIGVLVTLLLVAACGGSNDDAADPTTSEPTTDGTGSDDEATSDVDRDGVVREAYDLVASTRGGFTLDPTEVPTNVTDNGLFYLVYGTLLRPTADGGLEPDLAESTEIVDDSTIEITLREGLTFSDGTLFDADAVKAGLERNLAITDSPGYGTGFLDLQEIEVTSPTTLTLTIANGTAASWHDTFLGSWETVVTPPDFDPQNPVGAGPMMITDFTPETSMTLDRNPNYWDEENVLLGGIELIHAPDAAAGVSALQAGQVDVTRVETSDLPRVEGSYGLVSQVDDSALVNMQLCKTDGPLADPDVRKALNMAIDRQAISEAAFDGAYEPAHGAWPDGHRFHDPSVEDAVAHDPARARELLADAGYDDGFEFDMYIIQGAGMPVVSEILQQQFAEIGVTVNLVPSPNYVDQFLVPNTEGAGLVPIIGAQRYQHWTGDSVGNTCGYDDPAINELVAELNTVSESSDEAVDVWHEIEQTVVAEDTLSVFILFGATLVTYDDDKLGALEVMPFTVPVPDVRETFVTADG